MILSLAHVCIESNDLEATERFYNCLGLQRRFEFRNKKNELVGFYLSFQGNSYIEVIKVEQVRSEGVIKHFAIEVEDVTDLRKRLLKHGAEVSERKLGGDNTWMVSCLDPNGVFIEFHQYTSRSMQLVGGVCSVDYTP